MTAKEFTDIFDELIKNCVELKNKYIQEKDLDADYVCIFSHSEEEYSELLEQAKTLGKLVDETPTGPIFAFSDPPRTIVGNPKLLKIRKPDKSRPQRGDVDFNTNYDEFKKKYLDENRFTLIKRESFEMIELKDNSFNVLVYFSSIPLSKQ